MQRDCALRIAGRRRLTSFSVKFNIGIQTCLSVLNRLQRGVGTSGSDRCPLHDISRTRTRTPLIDQLQEHHKIVRNTRLQSTASSTAIQAQVASALEAPVSSRTIRKRLAEGHLGSRFPLRVVPLTPTHRHLRLEWCRARGNWTAVEWYKVVLRDESRFNLSVDDNRVRVWRHHGERLNPAFDL
ncbi:transposable element Tcb2 transposase [Trichonephila clavipes]|nr:transposable element Tcb2 transposase [Trichonephila clavipes]